MCAEKMVRQRGTLGRRDSSEDITGDICRIEIPASIGYGLVRGKNVGEEWLGIEAAAKRLRDKLMVELKKIDTKLMARAGERVEVVEVEVAGDRDSNAGQSQYSRQDG